MPVLQSQNTLQGALPQDSTLVSLKVLDVSRNQLTGAVPVLQHSSNLQVALFSHNQFSGSVPAPPPMNQLGMKCEDSVLALPHSCSLSVSVLLCLCCCVCKSAAVSVFVSVSESVSFSWHCLGVICMSQLCLYFGSITASDTEALPCCFIIG